MSKTDAIRKLAEDYDAAHQAGDGQALARMFRDDGVIIPPGKPAITGREDIDRFFSGIKGGAGLKTEAARIEVEGAMAYDYGTASWMENGGRKFIHYVDVYRFEHGQWKMQLSTWNSSEGLTE